MDALTAFVILALCVPLQVVFIKSILWFKNKFDKYEGVALNIIRRHAQKSERTKKKTTNDSPIFTTTVDLLQCLWDEARLPR